MSNPLEKFTGFAQIERDIRAVWAKYGVSKSADLPPEGQAEVRAAVARWQKAHSNKLGTFMDKAVKPLGLGAFEKAAGFMFGPAAQTAAHSLVSRAQTGDFQAKQAIGHVITQAAGGDPTAQKALQALTVARQQVKAFGPARAECLLAQGAAQLSSSAGVGCGPSSAGCAGAAPSLLQSLELRDMYTRGEWIPTGGGEVFVPAAYNVTTAGRYARARARLRLEPRTAQQLRWAFAAERRGELPLGTAQRWAHRATMGYESIEHGSAKTLRESLGLNLALK